MAAGGVWRGGAAARRGAARRDPDLGSGWGRRERCWLYGPAPGLAGLRPILRRGLPPDLAPLPQLSLLWEWPPDDRGQIRIHAT